MIDSPIKWVGGKKCLRSKVIARFPTDAEAYCELFAGAGWVLFGKDPHPVEVLNDKDSELTNLYRVLKWRPAELLEEIQGSLYSREMFLELRGQDSASLSELDKAVRTYLMIQMAFGAMISGDGGGVSFGVSKTGERNLFQRKSLKQIFPAAERLANVYIECGDFEKVITRFDETKTIFYADPPYLDTCGYKHEFDACDHERLASALIRAKGRFLVTVNDHPVIRDLYAGCNIEEATEARSLIPHSSGRDAAPILFICNYDTSAASTAPKQRKAA